MVQIASGNGYGSGFVVNTSAGKAVVTNAHVVGRETTVSLWADDLSLGAAEVLGVDEYLDLALIRLRADQVSRGELTSLAFGGSGVVSAGQDVFVLGYPKGYSGPPTLTRGVVSRYYTETLSNGDDATVIQTDAAVNSGNSGGPLLDRAGRVIGVIFAREVDGATGIAYATSSRDLQRVLGALSQRRSKLAPTPSPTPGPAVSPTGNWSEIRKIKITGTSRTTWVVSLHGWGPYSPDGAHVLYFRCSDTTGGGRNTDLFVSVFYGLGQTWDLADKTMIVLYGLGATYADADAAAVYPSNPKDPRILWWRQAQGEGHDLWASAEAKDEIVAGMLAGAPILVVRDLSGDPVVYSFDTTGFAEASREVRERCRGANGP